jgi:hypothetical protein
MQLLMKSMQRASKMMDGCIYSTIHNQYLDDYICTDSVIAIITNPLNVYNKYNNKLKQIYQ